MKNKDFFEKKKEWSFTKDSILSSYLVPYFEKIKTYSKRIVYIDCFAGKGKFDDGNFGSPLIVLDVISGLSIKSNSTDFILYFIEKNYAEDLSNNLNSMTYSSNIKYQVIDGKFEDNIEKILSKDIDSSKFLYIDPYGYSSLNIGLLNTFKAFSNKSVELLVNFNTWGLFRNCCKNLNVELDIDLNFDGYLIEAENVELKNEEITNFLGSDEWINLVIKYKEKKITCTKAERKLSDLIKRLFSSYKYVLNVPVYEKESSLISKYRLFYLTNNADGCVIMGDVMIKRIEDSLQRLREGQMSIFKLDTEKEIIKTDEEIIQNLLSLISTVKVRASEIVAIYYSKYGLDRSPSELFEIMDKLARNNIICSYRIPKYTDKGKLSKFIQDKGKNKLYYYKNETNY